MRFRGESHPIFGLPPIYILGACLRLARTDEAAPNPHNFAALDGAVDIHVEGEKLRRAE